MLLLTTMALVGLATGCRTISRGITESVLEHGGAEQWEVRYGSRVMYALTNDTLTEVEFEGSVLAGDVVARYQRGLGPQAQCVADRTAELLEEVSERTGLTISTRTTIYLLRFDQRPQNFDIVLSVEPNEFPLPLFIRAGDESCEAILAQNHSYPYLAVHELVETSLVSPVGGQVLPDLSWGALGLRIHVNNYTRWFRDGLANYGGYVAYEIVSGQIPSEQRLHYRQTLLHTNPFTSLAEVGEDLFSWRQSPATAQERTYYNAALGLFLLIADTYGEQAIRDIVGEIAARETVDGRDLIRIANRVLGTDVQRLAEEFEVPTLGIEAERVSPALALNRGVDLHEGVFVQAVKKGSAAERAGLKEKDVITAVGSTPVANLLDFELGLFKLRKQPSAALAVYRQGAGMLTIELPLEKSDSTDKTPSGRRSTSLTSGQLDVSCRRLRFDHGKMTQQQLADKRETRWPRPAMVSSPAGRLPLRRSPSQI
jgi:hypothetical protein